MSARDAKILGVENIFSFAKEFPRRRDLNPRVCLPPDTYQVSALGRSATPPKALLTAGNTVTGKVGAPAAVTSGKIDDITTNYLWAWTLLIRDQNTVECARPDDQGCHRRISL